eukprot:scaffold19628_cov28-Tisochrysis_lutea.AAC.3
MEPLQRKYRSSCAFASHDVRPLRGNLTRTCQAEVRHRWSHRCRAVRTLRARALQQLPSACDRSRSVPPRIAWSFATCNDGTAVAQDHVRTALPHCGDGLQEGPKVRLHCPD